MGVYAAKRRSEKRHELLPLLLLLIVVIGVILGILDPDSIPSPSSGSFGMLLLAFAATLWLCKHYYDAWSPCLFILGSLVICVLGWSWFPELGAHHALILPVLGAIILLGPRAGLGIACLATMLLLYAVITGSPSVLPPGILAVDCLVLWSTAIMVMLSERTEETTILALSEAYERGQKALELARDRQLELNQALKDRDLANREITRLNDLLIAAREAIEEARRAKEEFVANVSHELRTPLNMIIGFSDEILRRPELYSERLPQRLLDDVAAIRRNSDHLARLVDDVLDLVQADVGFMRLSREWTPIAEVITDACKAVGIFFERNRLDLEIRLSPDLPAIYCDRARIRQVVLNLLSNAARFTARGGATVEAFRQEQTVVVKVSDTGPGIGAATIQHLFEPFQQADPSIRRKYGGTGLGLAISKRFVEMHGGRIWIESKEEVGTTVSFMLPIEGDTPQLTARRWFSPYHDYTPRSHTSPAPANNPKPCIVVVEQSGTLSDLIARYLADVEVLSSKTLGEAIKVSDDKAASALVINEIQRGNTLLPAISLANMRLDIPVLTCWVPEQHSWSNQVGAQDYLTKPIRRDDLIAHIVRAVPKPRRILLADDDEEARQLFTRMLSDLDPPCEIIQANDGRKTLEMMRASKPDVVLLDLIMPGQDGFWVLAEKAEEEAIREIPVIIISAKDPEREPIVSNGLTLTRQAGLSSRDLAVVIDDIVKVLPPRFGAPTPPETRRPLPVLE